MQSKALKIYVCNVMTQYRETAGFKASDHVRTLVAHTHPGIVQVCIVNTKPVPPDLLERYRKEEAFPVEADIEQIRLLGYQVMAGEVISIENYVRHDADKLARMIIDLTLGGRRTSNGAPAATHAAPPKQRVAA